MNLIWHKGKMSLKKLKFEISKGPSLLEHPFPDIFNCVDFYFLRFPTDLAVAISVAFSFTVVFLL